MVGFFGMGIWVGLLDAPWRHLLWSGLAGVGSVFFPLTFVGEMIAEESIYLRALQDAALSGDHPFVLVLALVGRDSNTLHRLSSYSVGLAGCCAGLAGCCAVGTGIVRPVVIGVGHVSPTVRKGHSESPS